MGLYQQRMFNSNHRSGKRSFGAKDDPFKTLPLNSCLKGSKKYQTPYKSITTNATRKATMSLYSFTSKKKGSESKNNKSTSKSYFLASEKIKEKKRSASSGCKLVKNQAKGKRRQSKEKKRSFSANVQKSGKIVSSGIMNNLSFYRSVNNSLSSDKNAELMSKISKIFDLITLKIDLPQEIELMLTQPIFNLRSSLRKGGRGEIAKTMLNFKNQCGSVLQRASSADISFFLRSPLPESNRWKATNCQQFRKRQTQKVFRDKYFSTLIKKETGQNRQEDQRLLQIQNRLDEFLQRSLKNRKVYI